MAWSFRRKRHPLFSLEHEDDLAKVLPAAEIRQRLGELGINVLGVVVNGVNEETYGASYYAHST